MIFQYTLDKVYKNSYFSCTFTMKIRIPDMNSCTEAFPMLKILNLLNISTCQEYSLIFSLILSATVKNAKHIYR